MALKTAEKRGEQRGREEGIKEGEKQKALEIAKELLELLDNQTISKKTGLTIEDVENLTKEK